ncbi:MAG: hypothetical protein R3B47_07365 [Bacteroidia bacterium]
MTRICNGIPDLLLDSYGTELNYVVDGVEMVSGNALPLGWHMFQAGVLGGKPANLMMIRNLGNGMADNPADISRNALVNVFGNLGAGTPDIGATPPYHLSLGDYSVGFHQETDKSLGLYSGKELRMTLSAKGKIGIAAPEPRYPLSISPSSLGPKISLWDGSFGDGQFYGLGIQPNELAYQVPEASSDHVFRMGQFDDTSEKTELMRIKGTRDVEMKGSLTVDQNINVTGNYAGNLDSILKVITVTGTIGGQNSGADYPSWESNWINFTDDNGNKVVFSELLSAFAFISGFATASLNYKIENPVFGTQGSQYDVARPGPNWNTGRVFLKVITSSVEGVTLSGFVDETEGGLSAIDNSILFTLVAIGRIKK